MLFCNAVSHAPSTKRICLWGTRRAFTIAVMIKPPSVHLLLDIHVSSNSAEIPLGQRHAALFGFPFRTINGEGQSS